MKNRLVLLLGLAVVMFGFVGGMTAVSASNGAGGQATVEGNITFYEESTEPSSSTSETSGSLPSTGGGKLPQTGEMVRNYGLIGGGVILLALLFFLYRRKKEKEGQA